MNLSPWQGLCIVSGPGTHAPMNLSPWQGLCTMLAQKWSPSTAEGVTAALGDRDKYQLAVFVAFLEALLSKVCRGSLTVLPEIACLLLLAGTPQLVE